MTVLYKKNQTDTFLNPKTCLLSKVSFFSLSTLRGQIQSPWLGDKVDSGIGHRDSASLCTVHYFKSKYRIRIAPAKKSDVMYNI